MMKVFMTGIFWLLIFSASLIAEQKPLSPTDVVGLWNKSLYTGDIKTAKKLTSKRSADYIKQSSFKSIEGLSKLYQKNKKRITAVSAMHQVIRGKRALVIYKASYKDGAVKYWMDTLFLEDNTWKVALHLVQMSVLKKGLPKIIVEKTKVPVVKTPATKPKAKKSGMPKAVIEFVVPAGWKLFSKRSLPAADHGFMIGYQHKSGAFLTFYQYTRGYKDIPDDVTAKSIKKELTLSKLGIEQLVVFGSWESAKEKRGKTVSMGDSKQKALWAQYELGLKKKIVLSDIYVWSHKGTFLKIRYTGASKDFKAHQAMVKPFLTLIGKGSQLKEKEDDEEW